MRNFKITLSMKKEPNATQVFFKADGQRFKHQRTIKMTCESTYRIDLSFQPPLQILEMECLGLKVESVEISRNSTAVAYSAHFDTNCQVPCKKAERINIPILVKTDCGQLRLELQVKFYKKEDIQHSEWGSTFRCIEYECTVAETIDDVVAITREVYR